jgi:hypothetical protein
VSLYQSLQTSRSGSLVLFRRSFVLASCFILIVVLIFLACRDVFDLIVRGNTTIL